MRKTQKDIKTISEAIDHLEKTGSHQAGNLNEAFGKSFDEVKKAFENLKPLMEDIQEKIESEGKKTKHEVEEKIKESPWMAIGIVGLVAFIIGLLLGRDRR